MNKIYRLSCQIFLYSVFVCAMPSTKIASAQQPSQLAKDQAEMWEYSRAAYHANEAGRYLGSLIWYAVLFKETPLKLEYVPNKVPAEFAAYLKTVAEKTINNLNTNK